MNIKDKLDVQENISLAQYTTIKIGGPARYFYIAKTKEDLIKAIEIAKELNISFFILGGGSNLLFSDNGFDGLVIKMEMKSFEIKDKEINAEAGVMLKDLGIAAMENGLSGLEWTAGIPGAIGGTIYGNAQAFHMKISDFIKSVEVLNVRTLKIENFSKEDCSFSLKNSIFKMNKDLIILSVVLEMRKEKPEEIERRITEFLNYRKEKHPLEYPSAGSIFVNPKVEDSKVLEKYPEFEKGIGSGYLIDQCGLKGKQIGEAQISEKHANFIINLGKAKAKDVLELIDLAKQKVKDKFGIILEEEIQIVN